MLYLLFAAALGLIFGPGVHAFQPPARRGTAPLASITTSLGAIRFDKSTQKWYTDDPEERAGSSYGPIGSLYIAGPKPFLQVSRAVLQYFIVYFPGDA